MNRKTIVTKVASFAKAFCLAGLLSVPVYSSASTVSFEKLNGIYIPLIPQHYNLTLFISS